MHALPEPTVERLVQLSRLLLDCPENQITSAEIERRAGWASHTVRKDISYLPGELSSGLGYKVQALKAAIDERLGLTIQRRCCVVGLGRLGSAYLNFSGFELEGFKLVAGFDSNINRLEILQSRIPLYPAFKIPEVVQRFAIELAILCVPAAQAQAVSDILVKAGVKGLINFAPVALSTKAAVRNVYIVDELRYLSARIGNDADETLALNGEQTKEPL